MKMKKKHGKPKKPIQKTRKELRKEKRQKKKINRAEFYASKKKTPGKYVLNTNLQEKIVKTVNKPKAKFNSEEILKIKAEREKKLEECKRKEQEKIRQKQLQEDNEKEDAMIKQLEKRLKLNKRKSKSTPKSFADDGLDYILDFCNDQTRQLAVETEKQLLGYDQESDFDEDSTTIKTESPSVDKKNSEASDTSESAEDDSEGDRESDECISNASDEEFDDEELPAEKITTKKVKRPQEADESEDKASVKPQNTHLSKKLKIKDSAEEKCDISDEFDDDSGADDEKTTIVAVDGTWEDIYGRKRGSDGTILSNAEKYIPPAARLKQLENCADKEKLSRLRKQLKGLINRLAEHNMHTIATQVEDLYMANSRNDMNEVLSALMMESIIAPVITPERLIAEHMMFIAILHANVGTEVGAHFLLSLVKKFDDMMNQQQIVENKELDNLILMMAQLYNFKIYGCQLLCEILERLIAKFTEKEIELILIILKTVGFLMRKDNPVGLKELIVKIQQKAASSTHASNSRVQFMLDVLLAIKNNNMNKIPQYDPTHVEHLKKLLKNFLRKGNTVTQFNISLDDLLKVDEQGKWWIVGSAWAGNVDNSKDQNKHSNPQESQYSEKILELARKQRMNTDVRRSIFCILLTAEDYMDAFEKIHHLGLKNEQEREIVIVIIDCCLHEKKFNRYYAVLAQKFCDCDRKYQIMLQFALWDKLKSLNDLNTIQLNNLAQFLGYLLIEKGLSLSMLKIFEFAQLEKSAVRLLQQVMLEILLHDNAETCVEIFQKITLSPKLKTLRDGIRLFISHFLVKKLSKPLTEAEREKLEKRAELVDSVLIKKYY